MDYTVSEVLQYVADNDVKFIRLAFCDIFGTQKNVSIMPRQLPRAFESGIAFDASAVRGFLNVEDSDLILFPDPGTLTVLPWRSTGGPVVRLFCDIRYPDGRPFEGDGRNILSSAVRQASELGLQCRIGTECEFYLLLLDELGNETGIPHDNAGYCDVSPRDKGENIRREICLTLEQMGIDPERSHHEQGPGQNEIDFKYSDALEAADNLVTFEWVVRTIASRNGLCASFLPKPLCNQSGNGLHINFSISKNDLNLFRSDGPGRSKEAESFVQGILDRIPEITVFLNPILNSYERLGHFEAPKYITWSDQNRSSLIRIPADEGEFSRMELCSPDPTCNPYLALSLLLLAGLEGVKEHAELTSPTNQNLFQIAEEHLRDFRCLPKSLAEAITLAEESEFVKASLPPSTVSKYLAAKRHEIAGADI